MKVIELMAVPAIEKPTAQPGMARPPTKYPSVVRARRRTAQAIQDIPAKYAAMTVQSRNGIDTRGSYANARLQCPCSLEANMSHDWSRRTFLSAAGDGLLPQHVFSRLLVRASGGSASKARLAEIDTVAHRGPFTPSWESLEGFKVPRWYVDGKFWIFIHWGVYSVPAFGNEWYPRNMYKAGTDEFKHHVATYGPQARFGYKDFIPRFKAERYDAGQWASLFKDAGAKFVVPVAEHHDGFPLYAYPFTEWSAARMGPKRDTIGLLADAVREAGLVFGASSHRAEHWWFFDQGMTFDSDVRDPRYA